MRMKTKWDVMMFMGYSTIRFNTSSGSYLLLMSRVGERLLLEEGKNEKHKNQRRNVKEKISIKRSDSDSFWCVQSECIQFNIFLFCCCCWCYCYCCWKLKVTKIGEVLLYPPITERINLYLRWRRRIRFDCAVKKRTTKF